MPQNKLQTNCMEDDCEFKNVCANQHDCWKSFWPSMHYFMLTDMVEGELWQRFNEMERSDEALISPLAGKWQVTF